MNIDRVVITTADPEASGCYYQDTLCLPVAHGTDGVEVSIGRSVLVLRPGLTAMRERGHHLAFSVAPERFDAVRAWLAARTSLLMKDGKTVLTGPLGWHSRSLYFRGPDHAVLELIAHDERATGDPWGGGPGSPDDILDIVEVALAVSDVPHARQAIMDAVGVSPFIPVTDVFSPVGDRRGMFILTEEDRILLPTESTRGLRAPVKVWVRGPRDAVVVPAPDVCVVATHRGHTG